MDTSIIYATLSLASALVGVVISWIAFSRLKRKDSEDSGRAGGMLASDIGYIKAGVDDLKREHRETRSEVGALSTRVARCEESCKQAHHRIDEMRNAREHEST